MNSDQDKIPPPLLHVVRTKGLREFKITWDATIDLVKEDPGYAALTPGGFINNLVGATNKGCKTLLHYAAECGKLDIVEFILSHDPLFIGVVSDEKKTFLDYLYENGKINNLSPNTVQIIRRSFPHFDIKQPTTWYSSGLCNRVREIMVRNTDASRVKEMIFEELEYFEDNSLLKVLMQMISADTEPERVKTIYLGIIAFEQAKASPAKVSIYHQPTTSAAGKPL